MTNSTFYNYYEEYYARKKKFRLSHMRYEYGHYVYDTLTWRDIWYWEKDLFEW